MKVTKLYDSISPDNTRIVSLDKTKLTIENHEEGKSEIIEKEFDSEEKALDEYYKKMWETVGEGYNIEEEPFKGTTKLFDSQSDKICILTVDNTKLVTENIHKEKSKIAEKEFDSNKSAAKEYEKKVWANLKKGYIARNRDAKPGEALFHYFLGGCYDGALGFENTPKGIYIYRPDKQPKSIPDTLILLNKDGYQQNTVNLPQVIVPTMQYHTPTNRLYIRGWHDIYKYNPDTQEFILLLKNENKPMSFLSVQNDHIAYGSHPHWMIEDKHGNIIHQQTFNAKILSGSFPFCATLSKNGKTLAMSCEEGKVELLEAATGQLIKSIEGDFRTVGQMEFTDEDNILVIQEIYGKWTIRYFDIKTGKELQFKGLIIPAYSKETSAFCFNANESLMVQQDNWWIYVFDYKQKKHLYTFKLEHCVKRANIRFIDENILGVRTDYGCFSLYKI